MMTPSSYPAAGAPPYTVYPVALRGHLEEPLNRWLWLVKWLLLIPHYVVLLFLGVAFFLLTVVAFFAILLTGSYPRSIFDFNLGVLRWGWRVSFYGYNALGTDRYPPFSLGEEPDYPARLDIAYPEQLSRGLVLVKWWLLAIPHLIIIGLLLGGFGVRSVDFGVIGALTLIAGIMVLATANYPRAIFDVIMALNRWVARVIAYVALMRDEYPPFRFDQGENEPAPGEMAAPPVTPSPQGT